ncbi:C6 zinc finger domain protein [Ilyonectria destructans]|nr:C6 zinc finger domain protein [Ilyonectria destructans]
MGATIHPTQRRLSCETCRKHKSRCRRLHPNDPKCSRCTMHGIECTTGQQKKVGRPRRAVTPGSEVTKGSKDTRSIVPDPQAAWTGELISSQLASRFSEAAANELSWSNVLSPELTPVPTQITTSHDGFSTIEMDTLDRLLQMPDKDPSWVAPNDPVETCTSSTTSTSHWFNTPQTGTTASSPADSVYPEAETHMPTRTTQLATDGIAASAAIAKLSEINLNFHIRVAAAEANRDTIDLNSLIYRESPLYIDNLTLGEFVLGESQKFLTILTRLRASPPLGFSESQSYQGSQYTSTSVPSIYPLAASEPLLAPLALTITSIFIQLISLCELSVKHMTARIERIAEDPILAIPGLTFGGLPLAEPCTQGMMFCNVTVHLLERIERSLGIAMVPEGGEAGLLSAKQMDALWGELDEGFSTAHGRGAMRPANVREAYDELGQIFKQLSLN